MIMVRDYSRFSYRMICNSLRTASRAQYWIELNKTEKPPDEPPTIKSTGLEFELTERTVPG